MKKVLKTILYTLIAIPVGFFLLGMILSGIFLLSESSDTPPTTMASTPFSSMVETYPVEKLQAPIKFTYVDYYQDYAHGNYVRVSIKNLTDTNIAWVEYSLVLLNVKGEILQDDIRGWTVVSWYDGPISPGESIEINGGPFYNSYFNGSIDVKSITIHYQNGVEEKIDFRSFDNYEQIIFNAKDSIVYTSEHSASYHTNECKYKEMNKCNLEMTIEDARKMGKDRCQFCLPC